MNNLQTFIVGAFQTNTYIFSVNNENFVIDPAFLSEKDKDNAINKTALNYSILLTHNHLDHIVGIPFFKEDIPIYIHKADYENLTIDYLERAYNTYGYVLFENKNEFDTFKNKILERKKNMIPVNDNDVVKNTFKVIHTPGHTSGSVCFLKDDILFTGDTLFSQGYGRYDLESGSFEALMLSIKKLCTLPDTLKIYPGHGPATMLKYEKQLYKN